MRRVCLLVAIVALAACGRGGGASGGDPSVGEVTKITDGDTIHVEIGGGDETVRLIGIDTPESVDPRSPVECFGKEASAHLAELIPVGSDVRLVRDVEARDRYDRLLAYVYRESDALFVNLAMARDGFAAQATFPPNVAHVDEITAAVAEARDAGRGLWSACR
ncbi:MAG TPA: thermonuclease family protein [Acidimicrobiales bacterium]|nr:thermonuclease family protein [Acidimicrobiales bacterium]